MTEQLQYKLSFEQYTEFESEGTFRMYGSCSSHPNLPCPIRLGLSNLESVCDSDTSCTENQIRTAFEGLPVSLYVGETTDILPGITISCRLGVDVIAEEVREIDEPLITISEPGRLIFMRKHELNIS